MKLAIDCRALASGGIGTYLTSLLPYLQNRAECFLFGNENEIKAALETQNEHTKIFPCDVKQFSVRELFFFPKDLLEKINKCDAYYTPYCNIPGGIRVPVFSTIHDLVFFDVAHLTNAVGKFARTFFYKRAVKKSKIIFTVSEFSKSRIQKLLNVSEQKIAVTYNALPKWFSEKKKSREKKKLRNQNQIVFVGNIKKHKGLAILLQAFEKILTHEKNAHLVIVGNKNNFRTRDETVLKKIETFPHDAISFAGRVSNDELIRLYASSKILVEPSLYEGFGLPPLEALAFGCKPLISDIDVFKEIYADFPVTFFEKGNAGDLAKKALALLKDNSALPLIPQKYSYEKSADIIFDAIANETAREHP